MSRSTVVGVLAAYHTEIEAVLDETAALLEAGTVDAVRRDMPKLLFEVVRHVVSERQVLHPVVHATAPAGPALVAADADRLRLIERGLEVLERLRPDEPAFATALARLARDFRGHLVAQEKDVFPALQGALDRASLEDLAARLTPSAQTGPTYAHPEPGLVEGPDGWWPRPGFTARVRRALAEASAGR